MVTELLKMQYDHICYTGDANVGKIVMTAAAKFLTPLTLELGGKSPVIISKNANIKLAAKRVAWGKFACAGQTCVAPDYALVEESVLDAFIDALPAVIAEFYEGNPAAKDKMGRIVNERHWTRVTKLLAETKGKIISGGKSDSKTLYIDPTIVTDIAIDDVLMQEEIFGPILPLVSVPSVVAACTLAAQISHQCLGLYIMTESADEMEYVIQHTSSGGVALNDVMTQIAVPNLPFGGIGSSGMGAYHGKASIDTFSHRRSVVHVPEQGEAAFEWRYPSGDQVEKFKFYKQNFEAKL